MRRIYVYNLNIGELWRDEEASNINSAALSPPICTALQVALVDLLQHWGVKPTAVAGHSSGEIAAAYAMGAISRKAAWSISYHRGRLSSGIRGIAPNLEGAMLATSLGPDEIQAYLGRVTEGSATVACINSPSSITLSGDSKAIAQIEALLKADGQFSRRLKVDTAYHSPHMQVIADSYLNSLKDIKPLPSDNQDVKMFSSVTGRLVKSSDLGPSYWVTNMLSQVNFLSAVKELCEYSDGTKTKRRTARPNVDVLVEIGPHAALQGPLKQILSTDESKLKDVAYMSVLRRGQDACSTALDTLGCLFQRGYPVNVDAANNDQRTRSKHEFLVDIPPFSWNRENKYWWESQLAKNHRFKEHARKDLFGSLIPGNVPLEPRWRNIVRLNESPWVEFHKVHGTILYPAAGMLVMAIEAACQSADPTKEIDGYELRNVLIGEAIAIPPYDPGIETMLCVKPWRLGSQASTAVWQEFTLFSRQEGWEMNCSGLIRVKYKITNNALFTDEENAANERYRQEFRKVEDECPKSQNPRKFYEHFATIGLHYGTVFQNLVEVRKGHYRGKCAIKVPDTKSTMPHKFEYDHVLHPTILDSIIQMALPASTGLDEDITVARVPTFIERLYVSANTPSSAGSKLCGYATAQKLGFDDVEATVVVSTPEWEKPLVILECFKTTSVSGAADSVSTTGPPANMRKLCSYFHWKEDIEKLSAEDIKTICNDFIQEGDQSLVGDLELGAFIYMKRVLKAILPEESKTLAPHLQTFYQYMQRTYEQVVQRSIEHQFGEVDWLNTSEKFERELLERVSKGSTDGAVMCQHGENLIPILRGEIPPLQVLMKDNLLHNFYQSGVGIPQNYAQLAYYLDLLAHKNPDMKILEIGAGTGGATLPVLEALGGQNGTAPRFSNYTFTDISTGFFEEAREKLKAWSPFMTFAKLNIEQDPVKQDFQAAGFDVVIAANVLHATHIMDETLANVKKLLKP